MKDTAARTEQLKAELWRRFGTSEHPAEWDGVVSGGGRLSQRYWEYMKTLELLELDATSVLLDIGGGSPDTGAGFFSELVAGEIAGAVIMDPNVRAGRATAPNIEIVRAEAGLATLGDLLRARRDITHIASISVFEHIEPGPRRGITEAINAEFRGRAFVTTFEYHPNRIFFEHQLTARTTSELFRPLTRFYPDVFVSSPVHCENAFDVQRLMRVSRRTPLQRGSIPLWYPVAVRFVPVAAAEPRRGE